MKFSEDSEDDDILNILLTRYKMVKSIKRKQKREESIRKKIRKNHK